jgi:hypothetical protein
MVGDCSHIGCAKISGYLPDFDKMGRRCAHTNHLWVEQRLSTLSSR